MPSTVVKIGGSLFDLPELGERLCDWLGKLPGEHILVVPGGGQTADAVRSFDAAQRLGEEASHWLALRALSLNAQILQRIIPNSRVVGANSVLSAKSSTDRAIVDMYEFAKTDENRHGRLPHTWDVTSDSLALRLADVVHAKTLYLLKSIRLPPESDWQSAADRGDVDAFFPRAFQRLTRKVNIRVINFRERWAKKRTSSGPEITSAAQPASPQSSSAHDKRTSTR